MQDNETVLTVSSEPPERKLPTGLNVLTILTFIGCGFGLLMVIVMPFISKFLRTTMEKAAQNPDITTKQLEEMQKGRAAMDLMQANIVPITIVSIVGILLCLIGAIMMRKLKKDGYWLYVAGELAPLIVSLILMGTAQFTGASSAVFAIGLPVLFVILYTVQRKHLVY